MQIQFTELEKSMVKNMMMQKSYSYIATMLEKPVDSIRYLIDILANGSITMQMKLDAKKPVKIKKASQAKPAKPSKKKKGKTPAQLEKERKELHEKLMAREAKNRVERELVKNREHSKRKYKTLDIDYSKLVTVKINSKTFIYAKPGKEEEAKSLFYENFPQLLSKTIDDE